MSKTSTKLNKGIVAIIALSICLVFTSVVLALSTIPVDNNIFKTGLIHIMLGGVDEDGSEYYFDDTHKLITENEYLFEPGITVEKKFFIENKGGIKGYDVYYKIYFENVSGKLDDQLEITLKDADDNVLYNGIARDFTKEVSLTSFNSLSTVIGSNKHYLTISFHYPEECGNIGQGEILQFDLVAKAVQTKNNTEKEFD